MCYRWLCSLKAIPVAMGVYLTLVSMASSTSDHDLPNQNAHYPFVSRDQRLTNVLKYFGKNINVQVAVGKSVDGTVKDEPTMRYTRKSYLNKLAENHDFTWFYDGVVLHIVAAESTTTEAVPLKNNDGADILRLLAELNILQNKFVHAIDRKNSIFVVTGPAKYTDLVRKAIGSIEEGRRKNLAVLRGENSTASPSITTPEIIPTAGSTEGEDSLGE